METERDQSARSVPRSDQTKSLRWVPILGLTALYVALVRLGMRRYLWFDELLTFHLANAPTLSGLLNLVRRWDLNPPLLHLLAHASLRLCGGVPLAIRIPSVIEFFLASVLLSMYTARKLGLAYGFLPALLLWFSPMFQYATEARPYALLCFWFCGLLLLWDTAINFKRNAWVLGGIAFAVVGLLSSHVFAPLSLLPFWAAEAVRFGRTRKSDFALWAVLSAPLVLSLSYTPFYQSFKQVTYYPAAFQASLGKAAAFYWNTFESVVVVLALAMLCSWFAVRSRPMYTSAGTQDAKGLDVPESTLLLVLAVVPLILDLVMMCNRAPFWGRYCITSAIGICYLLVVVLAYLFRMSTRAGHVATLTIGVLLAGWKLVLPLYSSSLHPTPSNAAGLGSIRPDLPIVAASGMTFVEMGQYENRQVLSRLFYLKDRASAIRFAHATLFEDLSELQSDLDLRGTVEAYSQFTHEHRSFLVFGTFNYPEDWLLRKLAADGAAIEPLGTIPGPYKDKALYKVQLPPVAALTASDVAEARGMSKQ